MRFFAPEGHGKKSGVGCKSWVLLALLAFAGVASAQEGGAGATDQPPVQPPAVQAAPAQQPAVQAAPAQQPAVQAAPAQQPAVQVAPAQPPAADETTVTTTVTTTTTQTGRAPGNPRISVADLAYEEKVRDYFFQYNRNSDASHKSYANTQPGEHKAGFDSQYANTESVSEGVTERMERAELRKFTSDIKGELIKTNRFRVAQAKPWLENESPTVFDVIERVKKGYFPNSDLVLFGIVNAVDFRTESNNIQGSNTRSQGLYLDLVVEFSLIDTRTNEVVAGFTASGSGQDVRLGAAPATFNRAKVIQEASKDLGRNVAEQILEQYNR